MQTGTEVVNTKPLETTPVCQYCMERSLVKNGFYKSKQKWRCVICKRTTIYVLKRVRFKDMACTLRNIEIVKMRHSKPQPSLEEIGEKFNITRQRVLQIIQKHHYKRKTRTHQNRQENRICQEYG